MVQYKEFQGKSLDDAIHEACEYFGVAREKLEIEIVSDAKTGIFGLVGVKKAIIRAGRVDLKTVDALSGGGESGEAPERTSERGDSIRGGRRGDSAPAGGRKKKQAPLRENTARGEDIPVGREGVEKALQPHAEKRQPEQKPVRERPQGAERKASAGSAKAGRPARRQPDEEKGDNAASEAFQDNLREDLPEYNLAACDQDRLFSVVRKVVLRLVQPIVGDVPCEVSVNGARVRATLDCGDAAGLLVGRDGQTLASVQYLASRIISREIGGAVRLQVDAGKYRERQDDKLKEQALSLAARVKETGRPMSTRPLTAYQRRIVHLALEQDDAVQTHSKGEGAQRKVTISLKRNNGKAESEPEGEGMESSATD